MVGRFFSGIMEVQYLNHKHAHHKANTTSARPHFSYDAVLQELHARRNRPDRCHPGNPHIASQGAHLNAHYWLNASARAHRPLPVHYVGHLETLAPSFFCMLRTARAHHAAAGRSDVARALDAELSAEALTRLNDSFRTPSNAGPATSIGQGAGLEVGAYLDNSSLSKISLKAALSDELSRVPSANRTHLDDLIRRTFSWDQCFTSRRGRSGEQDAG